MSNPQDFQAQQRQLGLGNLQQQSQQHLQTGAAAQYQQPLPGLNMAVGNSVQNLNLQAQNADQRCLVTDQAQLQLLQQQMAGANSEQLAQHLALQNQSSQMSQPNLPSLNLAGHLQNGGGGLNANQIGQVLPMDQQANFGQATQLQADPYQGTASNHQQLLLQSLGPSNGSQAPAQGIGNRSNFCSSGPLPGMNELKRLSHEYTLAGQTAAASQMGQAEDQLAAEEASSIIIDTKTGGGNFIMSKEQKEGFIKGQQQPVIVDNDKKPKGNGQYPGEIQTEITNIVLEYVEKGDIDSLKKNLIQIGFKNVSDLCYLQDAKNFKQNALFTSSQIPEYDRALAMTEFLIKEGKCSPTYLDENGQTVLFYLAREGLFEMSKYFIQNGCEANHLDIYGQTPLFYAAGQGCLEIMELLIKHGADPNHIDHDGDTPIFYCIKSGSLECLQLLMNKHQVDVMREDQRGMNLIQYANKLKKHQFIEVLRDKGVYCPPEIRRKIQSTKGNKFMGRPRKDTDFDGEADDPGKLDAGLGLKDSQKQMQESKQQKLYTLTYFRDGVYQEVSEEEYAQLMQVCPEIDRVLNDAEALRKMPLPSVAEYPNLQDSWDKVARRIIQQLWRCSSSQIFHQPVDPEKLGIPDYLEVVKDPIDLGTIKQRLQHNLYYTMKDFVEDVQRCFDNCLLYNGEDSPAGQKCVKVQEEFQKLYQQLNVEFYLDLIPLGTKIEDIKC